MTLDENLIHYNDDNSKIEARFVNENAFQLSIRFIKNKKILNLGLGNGHVITRCDGIVHQQVVVEGSKKIIEAFAFESNKTKVVESYFEDYKSNELFDVVLANHVLEHVDNPVALMEGKFNEWLKDDGIIFLTVPNAKSIHRQIGKKMGMLKSEYELNSSDVKAGHQRVYDLQKLKFDVKEAGFEIVDFGGYNLKMVSLAQMSDWGQELLDAIFEVSKQMPVEVCANIWMTLRKKSI
ncbi:MAG: hypothetical protein COB02_03740 [Candidatus Cloacimonadota bacterium]|nr:MAG: hypothetical protein COB02_03740 [Candidatus Cloacimonadota bacterium]